MRLIHCGQGDEEMQSGFYFVIKQYTVLPFLGTNVNISNNIIKQNTNKGLLCQDMKMKNFR